MELDARWLSYEYCHETCHAVFEALDKWEDRNAKILTPEVIEAVHALSEDFKELWAIRLRLALVEACEEIMALRKIVAEIREDELDRLLWSE